MIGQFPWDPFPANVPLPKGPDPLQIHAYRSAVTSADAYRGVREGLRFEHDLLRIGNRFVPLGRYREAAFVAVGEAAGSMAQGAIDGLGEFVTAGFVAGPKDSLHQVPFPRIEVPLGPPVSPRSEDVVRSMIEIAETMSHDQLLLLLLSPGALSALALPPPGMTGEEVQDLWGTLTERGASGREIERTIRVLAQGGVGGGVGERFATTDIAAFVVDRGDGARLLGGGPVHPVDPSEREEVRALLERHGLRDRLPAPARERLTRAAGPPGGPVHRPVYVARPSDAITGAGDALYDRKWRIRLGMMDLAGRPESAAERFIARVEEVLAHEPDLAKDRSRGIAVPAMTTLDQPEGIDDGPAIARFLQHAEGQVRRRELSVGIFRTVGALGASGFPAGAVIGKPGNPEFSRHAGRARAVPMEPGITDVGHLVLALFPADEASASK